MVAPLGHPSLAQAIVAPLPPRTLPSSSRPPLPPPPFHSPSLPLHPSSSSPSSYLEGMQEAAVRVITRYFTSSMQAHQHQHQGGGSSIAGIRPGSGGGGYDSRRGSEEVPALTSFSSSSSSNVSTPTTNSPPQQFLPPTPPDLSSFHSSPAASPPHHTHHPPTSSSSSKVGPLPPPPLPYVSTPRSTTVPVTSHESDRNTAVRAMTHIGHLPFDSTTPSLSLLGTPLISPAPSLPTSPRTLTLSHLSHTHSSHLPFSSSSPLTRTPRSHHHQHDDPFNASPIFNSNLALGGMGIGVIDPTEVGGGGVGGGGVRMGGVGVGGYPERGTPVGHFWFKSGVNSLANTPRHGGGGIGGTVGGMGEVEFQSLFS